MARSVRRFDAYLVALEPVRSSEIAKTRPCVVVSPDELNEALRTVVIVPLTSAQKPFPFRVRSSFQGRAGDLALDHIRSVDKSRLVRRLGFLDPHTAEELAAKLVEMFRL